MLHRNMRAYSPFAGRDARWARHRQE